MAAYGDDSGFAAWLAGQGLTLPVGAPAVAILRQIGSAYLDAAYGAKLGCSRRAGGFTQALEWPRSGHVINGETVPSDLIPQAWIEASYRASYLEGSSKGWATTGVDASRQVKRQKVASIEREFFSASESAGTDAAAGMPSDSIINGMVKPWLCSGVRRMTDLFRVI